MSKINRKKIILGLLAAVLFCMSGCTAEKEGKDLYGVELEASQQKEVSSGMEAMVNYTTTQAENGEFARTSSASVMIHYPMTADLVCEKENANIREVHIKGRQMTEVKKGDPLITFDVEVDMVAMEKYTLKLQRCLEAMEKGKTERQDAIREAETAAESLGGRELELALLNIEKLKTEYEEFVYVSEAEAAEYKEQLAWMEREKEGYVLTAPFDGVIDYLEKLKQGDRVEKGQLLIQMHSEDAYYLEAEDIVGNLRYNAGVTITSGPKDDAKTYSGKVVSAYNVLLPAVPKGNALIRLDEDVDVSAFEVAPKYEADIERLQNVLLIDKNVIRTDEDKSYVRILDGDMVQKRYVLTGLRNAESVWVLDGISGDQKVIAE